MGQYRKKPVVIEAFKWTGHEDQAEDPVLVTSSLEEAKKFVSEWTYVKVE